MSKDTRKTMTILVVTDKDGHEQDSHGNPYGWYFKKEKELCERYCRNNDLLYKPKKVEVW